MTDYVNCPACKGKGVLPLEEARRIESHADAAADEARENAKAGTRAAGEATRYVPPGGNVTVTIISDNEDDQP